MDIAGCVVVVTGAGSGIGRATAELFAARGARVVAVDVDPHVAASPPAGAVLGASCDVADAAQVEAVTRRTVETLGRYDVLVNSAGVVVVGGAAEATEVDWDHVFGVNAKGTWLMCRAALGVMVRQGGGMIVNIASGAGLRVSGGLAVYSASKAAVVSLTRSIAVDYARFGVRAACICPGMIDTPMNRVALAARRSRGEDATGFLGPYLIKRQGRADEVAEAALFLAASDYITGATLAVDGGRTLY